MRRDFDTVYQLIIRYIVLSNNREKWEYSEPGNQLFIVFKKVYDSVEREILHNIFIEVSIAMKTFREITM